MFPRVAQPATGRQTPDPRLLPFLEAADQERARELLGELLMNEASPLLWRIIRARLAGVQPAIQEDVHSQALLRLTGLLSGQRCGTPTIEDLPAYIATVGANACREYLRTTFPERTRLARQLRYLLNHDPRMALWQASSGEWVGGLHRWRGGGPAAQVLELLHAARDPQLLMPGRTPATASLRDLVMALFLRLGGPCQVDALIETLLHLRGVTDAPHEVEMDAVAEPVATEASPEARLTDADYLQRVWREIEALPRRQRIALLLNLRDSTGRDLLGLLPLTKVADRARIAAALELDLGAFGALLPDLPREDKWIAEFLGLTRRQVVNLRKCARERLARRLGSA
jgi:hypothetical protein